MFGVFVVKIAEMLWVFEELLWSLVDLLWICMHCLWMFADLGWMFFLFVDLFVCLIVFLAFG